VLYPLTAQFFIPVLIPWCNEVSLSLDYESQAYIVSRKGKQITPYKHNSSISNTKIVTATPAYDGTEVRKISSTA
jgi:hypothetical protein